MRKEFVTVALDDGSSLLVETMTSGDEDVAIAPFDFTTVKDSVIAFSKAIAGILRAARPTSATAEFGIAMGVEAGKLTALLVQGTAATNIKISLTWEKSTDDANVSAL